MPAAPKQYIYYAVAARRVFIEEREDVFDTIVLPGTVATQFRQGAGGFVIAHPKPYVIDPRSTVLQAPVGKQDKDGRRQHFRLAEVHGESSAALFANGPLTVADLTPDFLNEVAASVLDFQLNYSASSANKLSEYLELLNEPSDKGATAPEELFAPYLFFRAIGDPWYEASKALIQEFCRLAADAGLPINTVCCYSNGAVRPSDAARIKADFAASGILFLWPDSLDTYTADESQLADFAQTVQNLSAQGERVGSLFSSYFQCLLAGVGLDAVAHGVTYGEHRQVVQLQGGAPPDRYYVPTLHRFYNALDAEQLIRWMPTLACACAACTTPSGTRRAATSLSRHELAEHFLRVRRNEVTALVTRPLKESIDEMRATYAALQPHFGSRLTGRGWPPKHLSTWLNVLERF